MMLLDDILRQSQQLQASLETYCLHPDLLGVQLSLDEIDRRCTDLGVSQDSAPYNVLVALKKRCIRG